ncbi:hypothetical protein SLA2020_252740 [Shorea laevis]
MNSETEAPQRGSKRQWFLQDFEIGKPLGGGMFGRVYEVTSKYIVALKVIFKEQIENDTFRRIVKVDLNLPCTPPASAEAKNLISLLLVKDSSKKACTGEDHGAPLDN